MKQAFSQYIERAIEKVLSFLRVYYNIGINKTEKQQIIFLGLRRKNICYHITQLLIFLLFFTGCEFENNYDGNGNVVTQRRNAYSFSEINVNGILDIYIKQGDSYKIEVVTDENLQDIVETVTKDGVLYISTKEDIEYSATKMDVYISMPDIERIQLEGVNALYTQGTMNLDNLVVEKHNTGLLSLDIVSDEFTLNADGVGDVELMGKAQSAIIDNDIVGDINAYDFRVYDLSLLHRGTGNVEVYVVNSISVDIKGVGNVYCKGNPPYIYNTGDTIVGHLYMVE